MAAAGLLGAMLAATGALKQGLQVHGAGTAVVNGFYALVTETATVPRGFALTCEKDGWDTLKMWSQLSDPRVPYYLHENGSYIYWNKRDSRWWIDEPSGGGVYVVGETPPTQPPQTGWKLLPGAKAPAPTVEVQKGT